MANKLVTTDPIPMELWSKDHWSLLLYIETCVVDREGKLDDRHMRKAKLDPRITTKNPTLLKDNIEVWLTDNFYHDDFSCLDDFEAEKLIINKGSSINPILSLTDYGWKLAHMLRRNRANKVKDKDFMPPAREEDSKSDVPVFMEQPSKLSEWEVWLEGFAATGEGGPAEFLGKYTAETFREAVYKAVNETKRDTAFFNPVKLSYWGCRFFDNEIDARKSFG